MPDPGPVPRNRLGTLIAQTARHWRRALNRHLAPFGLTEATWLPLIYLARAPEPMRQKDLAFALGLDVSSVVRLLDTLQRDGLIERREGSDRRVKELHLTDKGVTVEAQVQQTVSEIRLRVLGAIDEAELMTCYRVLSQVYAGLDAEIGSDPDSSEPDEQEVSAHE